MPVCGRNAKFACKKSPGNNVPKGGFKNLKICDCGTWRLVGQNADQLSRVENMP
tara:strand:+ start:1524 stop:1685 length:162 start_codon:yes stop_codon:yes gene_type:complete